MTVAYSGREDPGFNMTNAGSEGTAELNSRRVQRAIEYVEDRWFPVNQKLLDSVRKGFREGRYDLDIDFLVDDLKGDLSLFAYCIRELASFHRQENADGINLRNPIELIRWGGVRRLQGILAKDALQISTHRIDSINNFQRDRLSETLISASAVELLGEDTSVGSDLGFSSSVIRNLGLLLISWNYPTIYSQALQSITKTKSLDRLLSEALGFSPLLLATSLIKRWGLPGWWVGEDMNDSMPPDPDTHSVLCVLEKLHNIGEALARANNPSTYPDASEDWAAARKGIMDALGQQGLGRIQEAVQIRCEYYRQALPQVFSQEIELDAERKIHLLAQNQVHERNPYVRRCSLEIRTKLENVYRMINTDAISSEPIRVLTKQVLPYCGFSGCIVYVYDPGLLSLVPRMQTGRLELRKAVPVPYSPEAGTSDFISLAFECKTPLVETQLASENQEIVYMALCLGREQKAGVLYLEIPGTVASQLNTDVLTIFRAVAQTLMDCLHLG